MRIVELPKPIVTTRGEFGDGLADLVTAKLTPIAKHAHEPVLAIRVELERHVDPAVAHPVGVRADVNVNGRHVHAGATARTVRDAIDSLVSRLVRQLDDRPRDRGRRRPRKPE